MSGLNILIVGASIAGPATAYWLAKAGAKVTVTERFPSLRTGGQAVDIHTAGVSVMRKMPGMEAQVRAKSTQDEGVCFVREDGRPYGIIRATGDPDRQSLISEYEIYRGDLAEILVRFSKERENGNGNKDGDVRYVFGEQITSIRRSGDGKYGSVIVEFLNGLETAVFDLVVGCDGASSRTRAMGFDCGVRDHIFPSRLWAAYFSVKQDFLGGSKIGHGFSAAGGRSISIGSDPRGFSRVMLMGTHPRDVNGTKLPFRQAADRGDAALKSCLTQHYRGVGWKTDFVMQEMQESEDFYASEIVQVKIPRLYNGPVVLVGDAGDAAGLTGGGTSLALAGAYVLAGELSKHTGDLAAGLEGYEAQMRPLINDMQKIPPLVTTILVPQTAWGYGCGIGYLLLLRGQGSQSLSRSTLLQALLAQMLSQSRNMNGPHNRNSNKILTLPFGLCA